MAFGEVGLGMGATGVEDPFARRYRQGREGGRRRDRLAFCSYLWGGKVFCSLEWTVLFFINALSNHYCCCCYNIWVGVDAKTSLRNYKSFLQTCV